MSDESNEQYMRSGIGEEPKSRDGGIAVGTLLVAALIWFLAVYAQSQGIIGGGTLGLITVGLIIVGIAVFSVARMASNAKDRAHDTRVEHRTKRTTTDTDATRGLTELNYDDL